MRLFEVLRKLAADGVTLLYISHRMEELYQLCDYVSVLRDGRNAADFAIKAANRLTSCRRWSARA